jgi:hypothetical protein
MKRNRIKIHFKLLIKGSNTVFQEPHGGDKTAEKTKNHPTDENPQDRPWG